VIVVTGQLLHWTLTSPKQIEVLLLGTGLDRLKKLFRHHGLIAVVGIRTRVRRETGKE
jgi:hypothetical protein